MTPLASRSRVVGERRVDLVLQHVGWPKHQDPARQDRDLVTGLRVTTDAPSFLPDRKAPEGRALDHLSPRQSRDRKRDVEGKSGSVRVDLGGRRIIKKKKQ